MKKNTNKKTAASKQDRLKMLATDINEAFAAVEVSIEMAQTAGESAISSVVAFGKRLLAAKASR